MKDYRIFKNSGEANRWFIGGLVVLGVGSLVNPLIGAALASMWMVSYTDDLKDSISLSKFLKDFDKYNAHVSVNERNELSTFKYHVQAAIYGLPESRKQASRQILKEKYGVTIEDITESG